ncbi:hypothetical protein FISHEDRAFT_59601 [Fistulina hepatica ATCC 64428]|uniref:Concanavalin A-like lectin/glucanase n=1 Tax=Fistulina hepatica ATCC 64428 TaxID=1128425 RepID=A0A0D7A905_9AGAR|nr:hypothetical protein FISHEDRAFT_59601 [Fistulina hepatica ATCC 64428]
MTFFRILYLITFFCVVRAADWYTVEWDASEFTAMSGDMLVPDLPTPGGTPYVWPGIQGDDGVFQAVLDGSSGTWWIGDGFYGTPSLSWGNGFNVYPGDTVHFTFDLIDEENYTWNSSLASGDNFVYSLFNITDNTLDRAIFAVEASLYDVAFDFGPIIYSNVEITATTAASEWCYTTYTLGDYPYTIGTESASGYNSQVRHPCKENTPLELELRSTSSRFLISLRTGRVHCKRGAPDSRQAK